MYVCMYVCSMDVSMYVWMDVCMDGCVDGCEYAWIFFIEYLLCGSSIGWLLWKYSDCSCEGITGSTTHGFCSVVAVMVVVMVVVVVGETAIVISRCGGGSGSKLYVIRASCGRCRIDLPAAVRIQRVFRGRKGRKIAARKKLELVMCIRIQNCGRKYIKKVYALEVRILECMYVCVHDYTPFRCMYVYVCVCVYLHMCDICCSNIVSIVVIYELSCVCMYVCIYMYVCMSVCM